MVGGLGDDGPGGGGSSSSLGTKTICNFNRTETIGEGTYGRVFSGFDKANNTKVAIKKLLLQQDCQLPPTVTREIKILKQMKHYNIVKLIDVVTSKCSRWEFKDKDEMEGGGLKTKPPSSRDVQKNNGGRGGGNQKDTKALGGDLRMGHIYLVMEYVDHDLAGLIDAKVDLTPQRIKCIVKQILDGLAYMHDREIVHRDLKCSNILVSNLHDVKLADFGLARSVDFSQYDKDEMPNLTTKVVTLWYRAPELLYGNPNYGPEVDMWSLGCIIVELIQGRPLFPASNEVELMGMIYNLMGTPNPAAFERMRAPNSSMVCPDYKPSVFADKYRDTLGPAYDLVQRLLVLDPKGRATARQALNNVYFLNDPVTDPHLLPKLALDHQSYHEFETKKVKREKKQLLQQQQEATKLAKEGKTALPPHPNSRYCFPPGLPHQPPFPHMAGHPPHHHYPPHGYPMPPYGYPNGGLPPHLHHHAGPAGPRTSAPIEDADMDISDDEDSKPPPPPPPPAPSKKKDDKRKGDKDDRRGGGGSGSSNGKRRDDRDGDRDRDGRKRKREEEEEEKHQKSKPKQVSEAEKQRRLAVLQELSGGTSGAAKDSTEKDGAATASSRHSSSSAPEKDRGGNSSTTREREKQDSMTAKDRSREAALEQDRRREEYNRDRERSGKEGRGRSAHRDDRNRDKNRDRERPKDNRPRSSEPGDRRQRRDHRDRGGGGGRSSRGDHESDRRRSDGGGGGGHGHYGPQKHDRRGGDDRQRDRRRDHEDDRRGGAGSRRDSHHRRDSDDRKRQRANGDGGSGRRRESSGGDKRRHDRSRSGERRDRRDDGGRGGYRDRGRSHERDRDNDRRDRSRDRSEKRPSDRGRSEERGRGRDEGSRRDEIDDKTKGGGGGGIGKRTTSSDSSTSDSSTSTSSSSSVSSTSLSSSSSDSDEGPNKKKEEVAKKAE